MVSRLLLREAPFKGHHEKRFYQSNELSKVYKTDEIECSALLYYKGGKSYQDVCMVFTLDKCPRNTKLQATFKYQIFGDDYQSEVKSCVWDYDGYNNESKDVILMSRNNMNKLFEDVVNLKVFIFDENFQNIGNISRPMLIQKTKVSPKPFTTSLPKALLKSDGIHRKSKTYTTSLPEDISESNGIKWTCNPIKFYMDIEIKSSNVYLSFFIIHYPSYPFLSGQFKVWIKDKEHENVSYDDVHFINGNQKVNRSRSLYFMSCNDFRNFYDQYQNHNIEVKFEAKFSNSR